MSGSVYRRCACRDEDGKQLGSGCPKLGTDRKHGVWYFQVREPGKKSPTRRGGFETKAKAQAALKSVISRLDQGVAIDDRQTTGQFLVGWLAGKRM